MLAELKKEKGAMRELLRQMEVLAGIVVEMQEMCTTLRDVLKDEGMEEEVTYMSTSIDKVDHLLNESTLRMQTYNHNCREAIEPNSI